MCVSCPARLLARHPARVRCDLKDLPPVITPNGPQHQSCSNCRERNIKCVYVSPPSHQSITSHACSRDEFAEVKAVKLLRRGRRLQQVECVPIIVQSSSVSSPRRAVYGKVTCDLPLSEKPDTSTHTSTPKQSVIPQLKLDLLNSTFFRRFCVQRTPCLASPLVCALTSFPGPIIEPTEFTSRYLDHINGTSQLNIEGQMIAMLLVTWAASFGINECGVEIDELDPDPTSPKFTPDSDDEFSDPKQRAWTIHTEAMTQEILALVDAHGILRRPSWDGVSVLLLLLPLTEGLFSLLFQVSILLTPSSRLTKFNRTPCKYKGIWSTFY